MTRIRMPSPALIVALIALFVAIGGTSYAVTRLPAHSVGSVQLKDKSVTKPKLALKSVDATKLVADSLTGAQVNEGTLAEVPSGGIAGLTFKTKAYTVAGQMVQTETLTCDLGLSAIAGGAQASHDMHLMMVDSHPVPPSAWQVSVANIADSGTVDGNAWVVCAKAGPGTGTVGTAAAVQSKVSRLAR